MVGILCFPMLCVRCVQKLHVSGRQRSWFSFDVARKWLLQYYVEQVVYLDRFWLKEVRRPFLQRCECAITTDQSIRDAADHDAET